LKGVNDMPLYQMTVTLEMTDFVEADSPEEAFEILSNDAMNGGDWQWDVLDEGE
jgi:hypothetical protein